MNKLLTLSLLLVAGTLYAQEKRINLYSSYVFDDSFEFYNSSTDYYSGKLKGGYQWGAGLEFKVRDNFSAELIYLRQNTQCPVSYYNTTPANNVKDISVNYYLLGLNRYLKTGRVEPYGGLLLGAAGFINKNPTGSDPSSITKFALGLRLGADIWVSEKVALKLQAQFLSSVQAFGGSFYFGTGGSGAGVSTYSSVNQLSLGGGLAFKLGQ